MLSARVAIAGIGGIRFAKRLESSKREIALRAILAVLTRASLYAHEGEEAKLL